MPRSGITRRPIVWSLDSSGRAPRRHTVEGVHEAVELRVLGDVVHALLLTLQRQAAAGAIPGARGDDGYEGTGG